VGCHLHFAADVERWLLALEADRPQIARQVNDALDRLKAVGEQIGPPLVVPVDYHPGHRGVALELDRSYQRRLQALTRVRREVSEVAALRKCLEARLDDALPDDQRERLRGGYDGIAAQEEKLTQVSRRMDQDLQAYRARKETLKASLVAALVDELTMLADADDVTGATAPAPPTGPLMELRPGAPEHIVARLLFTVEPGQTALLIAAATERDVLSAWYDRVVPDTYVPGATPPVAAGKRRPQRRKHGPTPATG